MQDLIFTLSTGKVIDGNKIKFDLLSRDPKKGAYHLIFEDDSEVFLTVEEYIELLTQNKSVSLRRS